MDKKSMNVAHRVLISPRLRSSMHTTSGRSQMKNISPFFLFKICTMSP